MLEVYEQRLKNIEDKVNEIIFALESNEIRMKIPVSPIEFKEEVKQSNPSEEEDEENDEAEDAADEKSNPHEDEDSDDAEEKMSDYDDD